MLKDRVQSVDVLRGITIVAMILVNNPGTWAHIYPPLRHADWHGYTPTDLIFPFFLFIVGISISFAYSNKSANFSTYKKITIRSLKLIGLGLFLGWFLPYAPFFKSFDVLRFPGVLQRIGLVFFVAAILNLNFNWKILIGIIITILVGYFLWMGFVPLPNGDLPTFNRAPNNWANYLDVQVLGNHTWKKDYDPEGLLSTLPAIATTLIGILIGQFLMIQKQLKIINLIAIGLLLVVFGYVWNVWFPINKALWSSSFVLITAGWATILLSVLYYIIDIQKINFGTIFKYVGSNAILIFFMSGFIAKNFYLIKISGKTSIHSWLYQNIYTNFISSDKLASLCYALTVVGFYCVVGYVLYKKKIFVKV